MYIGKHQEKEHEIVVKRSTNIYGIFFGIATINETIIKKRLTRLVFVTFVFLLFCAHGVIPTYASVSNERQCNEHEKK